MSSLSRREFLRILLIAGAVISLGGPMGGTVMSGQQAKSAGKPNIILILSDDVGLGNIGCCGGPFKTPHIDKLAKEGLRFSQCYSAPLCGPSRCQTLTGRYPFRTGLLNNQSQNAIAPEREVMIPTMVKKAGYVTGSCGKWGQMCLGPGEWGFDEYLVFKGSGRYWREQTTTYTVNGEQKNLPADQYLPDIMHNFVVDFLAKHKDQPFFLYYPMSHIHGPIVRTPDSQSGADQDRLYADNIEYMDKLVGKLIAELDRLKLREKTLILFTGDNGTARFGVETATVNGRSISGMKGTMLEGGSRVPLIANWPGTTPAGKVLNDLIDFSDFFPTFADLGGAKLPDGVKLDGHSLAPQLRGEKGTLRDWIYVQLGNKWYVRDQGFKLTQSGELFEMTNAPFVEKPANDDAAQAKLQAVLDQLNPAGGKTIFAEDEAAAKDRTKKKAQRQKQGQQQGQKKGQRKAKAGQQPQP